MSYGALPSKAKTSNVKKSKKDRYEIHDDEIFTGTVGAAIKDVKESCEISTDCLKYPYKVCNSEYYCEHKGIFPMHSQEAIGLAVLAVMLAMANVGGVGGGGLIIPIIMAFFKFTTKGAIALSGFTIFTGSLARFIYAYNMRHPDKDATLIDYGIVIVMMPLVLVGSFIGVLVNIMLPSLILSITLTFILLALTI